MGPEAAGGAGASGDVTGTIPTARPAPVGGVPGGGAAAAGFAGGTTGLAGAGAGEGGVAPPVTGCATINCGVVVAPKLVPVPTYIGARSAGVSSCDRRILGVMIMTMSLDPLVVLVPPKIDRRKGIRFSPGNPSSVRRSS